MSNLADNIALCIQEKPCVTYQDNGARTIKATLSFPETFVGFDGHFPNNPIVPGIAQIMVAAHLAKTTETAKLIEVKRCKFLRPIKPCETIQITVETTPAQTNMQCHALLDINGDPCANITFTIESGII